MTTFANEVDLQGQVISFLAYELHVFTKINEKVSLNNPVSVCHLISECLNVNTALKENTTLS